MVRSVVVNSGFGLTIVDHIQKYMNAHCKACADMNTLSTSDQDFLFGFIQKMSLNGI